MCSLTHMHKPRRPTVLNKHRNIANGRHHSKDQSLSSIPSAVSKQSNGSISNGHIYPHSIPVCIDLDSSSPDTPLVSNGHSHNHIAEENDVSDDASSNELPGVSIIKPLMGVDALLEANLESHFRLNYPRVCICVQCFCIDTSYLSISQFEICILECSWRFCVASKMKRIRPSKL